MDVTNKKYDNNMHEAAVVAEFLFSAWFDIIKFDKCRLLQKKIWHKLKLNIASELE